MSAALSQNKRAAAAVAVMGIAWAVLAGVVLAMPLGNILGFLAFQLFAVALPGIAVVKLLRLSLTPLGAFTASYGFGFAVNVALYFCFAPFFFTEPIRYCVPVIAVASAFILYKKRRVPFASKKDGGELMTALIVAFVVFVLAFIAIPASHLSPLLTGARRYFHDNLHGISMAASAARGFPLEYLQMTGMPNFYHPFLYSYSAVMEVTLGMTAFEVLTKLTLITIAPFLASCTVLLAKSVLKSRAAVWIAAVFAVALPVGGTMYYYVYQDLLGFQLGVAFGLLSLFFFLRCCEESPDRFDKSFFVSALFLIGSLGGKGPVGATFAFGICFVLLIRIIRDKNIFGFAKGAALAAAFFAFYFLLYRFGGDGSMSWSVAYSAQRTSFGMSAISSLPAPLGMIAACAVYALRFLPAVSLALAASIILLIRKRGNSDMLWFCTGSTVCGMAFINLFKQIGSSELYFIMSIFQVSVIVLVLFGETLYDALKKRRLLANTAAAVVLALTAYYCVSLNTGFVRGDVANAIKYSRFSDSKITTPEQYVQLERDGLRRSTITPEEYEAFLWIRENTEKYAVFADYRYSSNTKFAYGTALSEHGFYLEGTGFATAEDSKTASYNEFVRRDAILQFFFRDEDETFIPLLKQEGIDYVIVTDYLNPDFEISDVYAEKVFTNSCVDVYKII